MSDNQVNVILIISDSLRADYCGCYGNRWVRTPNIDALAASGALFNDCHSASFPTGPMRRDLHSGTYSFAYSAWQSAWQPRGKTLAELLQRRGYGTGLIGDTPSNASYGAGFDHFEIIPGQGGDPKPGGRTRPLPADPRKLRTPLRRLRAILRTEDTWRGEEDRFVAQTMRAGTRWLEAHRRGPRPLFLVLDTFDPHEPWNAPRHYLDLYDPDYAGDELFEPAYEPAGYASEAEVRHMRCLYAAEVTLVDHWVGYLLDALERLRIADSTVVILTSDHGFYHGEHGLIGKVQLTRSNHICRRYPLYRTITHVPLVMRGPGIASGRRVSGFCQPPDLMPTVLDSSGARIPASVQGASLRGLAEGGGKGVAESLSSYTFLQDSEVRAPSTLRTQEWCYVYGGDEAPSELFDLKRDPDERHNVIGKAVSQAQHMHRRYVEFLERIGCPRHYLDARREFDPTPRRHLPRTRML